ncbi:MAG: sulfotransferase domain-containing protein [Gammaproteobacteria bacterium]|nr:sulfotransferase domain-containing protein [Gammaproteobacteria bacterium]
MSDPASIDPKWGQPDGTHDPWLLAHFQAVESDVLITTAPKAGTTWMQQILYQMRSGGDPYFDNIDAVVPWLERPREGKSWQQVLDEYDALPRPRLFKTHCTAEQTPGLGTASIVLTVRDPRECCVSFYHHLMNMTDEALEASGHQRPDSFAGHVDNWLEFAAWYRNVKSWWPYHNDEKVLLLRYTDLKRDLAAGIDQIAAFLGWEVTPEQKAQVLEYSSFDWMKAHDEKFSVQAESGKSAFKPGHFIRQGKVGAYRDQITPELEKKIINRAYAELESECLHFLGI